MKATTCGSQKVAEESKHVTIMNNNKPKNKSSASAVLSISDNIIL